MAKQRYRSSLQNVRMKHGADIGSDHHLVVTKIKMRLSTRKNLPKPRKKFNVGKLKQKDTKQMIQLSLYNRFDELQSNEAKTEIKSRSRDGQHSKKQLREHVKTSWDEHISKGNRGSVTNHGRR